MIKPMAIVAEVVRYEIRWDATCCTFLLRGEIKQIFEKQSKYLKFLNYFHVFVALPPVLFLFY